MNLQIALGFGVDNFKVEIQVCVKRLQGGFDEIQPLLIDGLCFEFLIIEWKVVFFSLFINEDFHHPVTIAKLLQDVLPGFRRQKMFDRQGHNSRVAALEIADWMQAKTQSQTP